MNTNHSKQLIVKIAQTIDRISSQKKHLVFILFS